jgi:hypothetical protein
MVRNLLMIAVLSAAVGFVASTASAAPATSMVETLKPGASDEWSRRRVTAIAEAINTLGVRIAGGTIAGYAAISGRAQSART